MDHLKLHRRSILTGHTEIVTGANVIARGNNNTGVVVFDDEPNRKRWYCISDGRSRVDVGRFHEFWIQEVH
tara:strand:+ start:67 stop:279 length:213 start_codon:yes stop_codon:yes gene_type:complete